MTRSKIIEKHSQQKKLTFSPEDLRWATPEIVADYRAKKLKCSVIADIGCGIGLQSFSFAKNCNKVYAIEIDKEKIEKAKTNAKILGLKNIIFINGDALDQKIIDQLKEVEIVFCDPERLPQETARSTETIKPNVQELLEKYSKITSKIAIEFPPQIKEINFDCEREYISINGVLNRLTLYFGKLKQHNKLVVLLPQEQVLVENRKTKLEKSNLLKYIYEIDPAIIKAELVAELCAETKVKYFQGYYCTANDIINSNFLKNRYLILGQCDFNPQEIIKKLKENNAGKLVLRFNLDPKEYWKVRNQYEAQLKGEKKLNLFKFEDKAVIAELI